MEYDPRMIVKFLWNEGANACAIADGQTENLQAHFGEHAYQLRTIRF
jgi:hypothetical protein